MIAASTLIVLLLLAWFANAGRDRSWTMHRYILVVMGAGAFVMLHQQDWWALALFALLCWNALRRPWPMTQLTKISTLTICYSLYALSQPVTMEMRFLLLAGVMAVGLVAVALWHVNHPMIWQHNHTNMLLLGAVACAWALTFLQSPWWVLATAPLIWPLAKRASQAWGWMGLTLLAVLAQASLLLASIGLLLACIVVLYKLWPYRMRPDGPDHGRMRIWAIMLISLWGNGWKERLFGLGWGSWTSWADSFSQMIAKKGGKWVSHNEFFANPHNEYVWMTFEHGLVGLGLMLGLIGSLYWQAWQTAPPLIIPLTAVCAMALSTFPWTLPLEIAVQKKQYIDYVPFGCMGAVVLTLVIRIMLG